MTENQTIAWQSAIHAELRAQDVRQVAYVPDAGHRILIEQCIEDPDLKIGSEFTVQFPGELVECVVKTRDLPLSGGFLFGVERVDTQCATTSEHTFVEQEAK